MRIPVFPAFFLVFMVAEDISGVVGANPPKIFSKIRGWGMRRKEDFLGKAYRMKGICRRLLFVWVEAVVAWLIGSACQMDIIGDFYNCLPYRIFTNRHDLDGLVGHVTKELTVP